ncbi:unnamed protein product, partial [Nesidiocoris tenuis]
ISIIRMSDDFLQFVLEEREFMRLPAQRAPSRAKFPNFFTLPEREFYKRFRFRKSTVVNNIYPLVKDVLEVSDQRGKPVPSMIELLGVLRFFATGSFQIVCGDMICFSQSTMSRLVKLVSRRLAQHVGSFVKFPNGPGLHTTKQKFFAMHKFPGVIGCIDCTHINIQKPKRAKKKMGTNQTVGGPPEPDSFSHLTEEENELFQSIVLSASGMEPLPSDSDAGFSESRSFKPHTRYFNFLGTFRAVYRKVSLHRSRPMRQRPLLILLVN